MMKVLIALAAFAAIAYSAPLADTVVPEIALASGPLCSFEICEQPSKGAGMKCTPVPSDCINNQHCVTGKCAEEASTERYGEAADLAGIQPKVWTAHATGGVCAFNKDQTDCAICVAGGCQCGQNSVAGRSRCAECGPDMKPTADCENSQPHPEAPALKGRTFQKLAKTRCSGHKEDLLQDYQGTVEQCQAKCIELQCAGFVMRAGAESIAQGNQASAAGRCTFRRGPLEGDVKSDFLDCYKPVYGAMPDAPEPEDKKAEEEAEAPKEEQPEVQETDAEAPKEEEKEGI